MRHLPFVAVMAIVLSACGFQLQGRGDLPEELRQVEVDFRVRYQVLQPPLVRALRERIESSGGEAGGGENAASLRITTLVEENQVLSVNADGRAIEFLYTTTVGYELIDAGRVRVPYNSLSLSREYSFDNRQVLSTEREVEQVRAQLQEELAELILLRLKADLRSS